jgi:Tfp pilus tip-associated adhesin PilY1
VGDSAQIPAVIPSHVNEDASLSQWAIWNGSLKSYALDGVGNIPVVAQTPIATPAPTATPAVTPTPGGSTTGVTTVAGFPDESNPNDADPTTRRPVWNAARVLGYTDPVADLDEGLDPLAAIPSSKAHAIKVWPGRKMVWASGSASTVPLTRQDFNCPPDSDSTTCSDDLVAALGLDKNDSNDQKKAKRTVEFLRGGKTSYGSRDEILTDIGTENPDTYGQVDPNTKYSYYYQDDQPLPGNPQVRTDGEATPHGYPHKLGAIFHSEPAVLLPPKYFQYLSANVTPRTGSCGLLSDCSYGAFATRHSKRRRVIFAGANDGFLHAFDLGVWGRDDGGTGTFAGTFDLGTGREIFAYSPKAVMNPGFASLPAFPPPAPQYFVDGSPVVADVFIDTAHSGTPVDTNRTWKTVLVGGLRQGGHHYFALDVTQPDQYATDGSGTRLAANKDSSPDCFNGGGTCSGSYPTILWEMTDSATPAMGETWSRPVVGRIKVSTGSGPGGDRYVAIFGGGFDPAFVPGTEVTSDTDTTQGRALYIVSVETGKILYKATAGLDAGGNSKRFAPMPAPPAVVDVDDDGYLDLAYIGDLNGRMWRVDLSQGSCQNCGSSSETLTGFQPFLLYDSMTSSTQPVQPIFYDAGIIFISGGIPPTLGVAFGSGYRADLLHSNGSHVNRFVFVKDSGTGKTFHEADLVNLTPTGGVTTAGTGPAPTTAGYFLDFASFTEKAVSTVFSTLGNLSLLTFSSDSANSCNPRGTSFRYRFSYATGQGGYTVTLPAPGQPGAVADYRQSLGQGMAMAAQGQAPNGDMIDTALMQSGELNQQKTPGSLKTLSQNWKER